MTDTSKEAVERLATIEESGGGTCDLQFTEYAPTIRALLAERDALQSQLNSPAHAAKMLLDNCPNPIFDELKYQMMGEFNWSREISDENGDEVTEVLTVPWITCKDIITSALRAIALDTTTATCDNTREGE